MEDFSSPPFCSAFPAVDAARSVSASIVGELPRRSSNHLSKLIGAATHSGPYFAASWSRSVPMSVAVVAMTVTALSIASLSVAALAIRTALGISVASLWLGVASILTVRDGNKDCCQYNKQNQKLR